MSAINKKQMKDLMKDIKDGRVLKKVLSENEEEILLCLNQSLKYIIITYNRYNTVKSQSYYENELSQILKERNILLGRKEEKKKKRPMGIYRGSDGGDSSLTHKKIARKKWNARIAEMAKYEAMGALWCGTPLCEDVIGEIMTYL